MKELKPRRNVKTLQNVPEEESSLVNPCLEGARASIFSHVKSYPFPPKLFSQRFNPVRGRIRSQLIVEVVNKKRKEASQDPCSYSSHWSIAREKVLTLKDFRVVKLHHKCLNMNKDPFYCLKSTEKAKRPD